MVFDKRKVKDRSRWLLDPVVSLLAAMGVRPIVVSIVGLGASVAAAYVIVAGSLVWGGVWTLVSGFCDMMDGSLARRRGEVTEFGAFIDSTFDRVSELLVYGAIFLYYTEHGYSLAVLRVVWAAMAGSILVSYARARIEGLGHTCTVGLLERPERLVLVVAGLFFGARVLVWALVLVSVGALVTVIQRVRHAYVVTRRGS